MNFAALKFSLIYIPQMINIFLLLSYFFSNLLSMIFFKDLVNLIDIS